MVYTQAALPSSLAITTPALDIAAHLQIIRQVSNQIQTNRAWKFKETSC